MSDETIPVLRVANAAVSVQWYRRLGYELEWVHQVEPGLPAFVSLARRGAARLFLSEHAGDARPNTLIYVRVGDVDAIAAELGEEVLDQPWAREIHITDPDANRLRIGTPRAAPTR